MKSYGRIVVCVLAVMMCGSAFAALQSFITMKNGYFYDSGTGQPWVPHGIAYQTWNRPLGVWQTTNQIDYDLDEMVKMGANSIRVDFVWKHIEEKGDNQWSWANYDYLVQACEKRNLRIFALIGYQWPPDWFQDAWYTMHPPETDSEGIVHTNRWQSDIINYEHPTARAQYAAFFSAVCGRYATNKAIAAWIVGNEYGYLGLWSGLLDGYDPQSEAAFRTWCASKYGTIAAANTAWGASFTNFNQVKLPEQYRAYGLEGAIWADAVQWREASIANFTAMGARAARAADTNHLLSYSTVGMQWGEEDWRYHAEDRGKITAACAATNAPLSFFSVNNYPWSILGHESQNGQWGISFTKKVAGVPVMYSETGFTSSETMWPGMNEARQGPLVRNALWESLETGAIGTHIFSWMDRPWITDREKGFGVLYADRNIKPAFWTSRDTFTLMDQVKIQNLLAGSKDPQPDVAFLWTDANDSQYNRYECEMQQMAGALERLGYEPGFMNLNELGAGAYTNYKVIILPRNMRVEEVVPNSTNKTVLNFLDTVVIPKGVHVLASADLPGWQDFNGKDRWGAYNELYDLFGIAASDIGGFEAPMRRNEYVSWYWQPIQVKFTTNALGSVAGGYTYRPEVWKYSDGITLINGGVAWAQMDSLRNKGFEESNTSLTKWDGTWGNVSIRNNWGWQYDGSNMVQMWGDAGMWDDFPVVPFGRYTHSAWLRSNSDDPLRNGAWARVQIEWRNANGTLLETSSSYLKLTNASPNNTWVKYTVDAQAPSNAATGRRITRCGITSTNSAGSVYVDAPQWSPALVVKNHYTAKTAIFLYSVGDNKPDGNADNQPDVLPWKYRYDVLGSVMSNYFGVQPAIRVTGTNAYMCLADYRTLADGATLWQIKNYSYNTNQANGGVAQTFTITSTLLAGKTVEAFQQGKIIEENSDGTIQVSLDPDGMEMLLVYDASASASATRGYWKMDEAQWNGAASEVRDSSDQGNHGQAYNGPTTVWSGRVMKAGSFDGVNDYVEIPNSTSLQVAGNLTLSFWIKPENLGSARINPLDKSYGGEFGLTMEPSGQLSYYHGTARASGKYTSWAAFTSGTLKSNEWQHIAITRNAATRQLKSYLNGKLMRSTTYSSSTNTLPTASTYPVRIAQGYTGARLKGLVDEVKIVAATLSDAAVATEAAARATPQRVYIQDGPSAVHPFGDKTYQVTVKYDCRGTTGLKLKCAFMENGNNGDTVADEIYSVLTNSVTGSGTATFWMWIPDYNTTDSDYKSTLDGGKYQFAAWLENGSGVHIADAVPQSTILEWGLRPTNTLPSSITKGQSVAVGLEWEDLYEQLFWQNTPLMRNSAFPSRVAVFRSLKTESQFPGHLTKVNETANWLESMGYTNGNLLSVLFDNVQVGSFSDTFEDGNYTGWTRAAGCANWTVATSPNGGTSGTVGYWRFDETAYSNVANEVKDSSGKACHGRAYNGAKITNDARRTRAVYFDGANDYVEVTNRPTLQVNGNLTLSFWVKASNLGARRVNPLDKSYGGEFGLTIETNRSMSYYHGTSRSSGKYIGWTALPAGSLANGSWYHVVITRDVATRSLKSYLNGVLKSSTTYANNTNTLPSKSTYPVRMAVGYTGLAMGGVMDEVKICSTVWSAGDVMSEYRVGLGSKSLQAARIGNSDNIMVYSGVYTNFTFSTDIRYLKQDNYFNDAEVYFRYQNRDNFYKVGIKNYYGFWRLKYTVRARTNIVAQGWICDFPKTNRPVENTWYNLKIVSSGKTNQVYFNNELKGSFIATNFASGKIGVGSSASQLGTWESQKAYYFIDDDEYSFWAPEGQPQTSGKPLNLDWGYLDGYYSTLILPSVYVMSDIEASNVWIWITNGLRSVIATDGSVGMKNETGAYDLGRMEKIFGVGNAVSTISNVTKITIGSVDHYATLDYTAGNTVTASGTAHPWTTVSKAQRLGTFSSTSASAPALLAYTITNKMGAPAKAFCFNMAADTSSRLTGTLKTLAGRAFEWSRGQAYKLCLELKYQVNPAWPDGDLVLYRTNVWILVGSGTTNITVKVPTDGIMTGNKCYWCGYVYPWDSTNAWASHAGFFATANDGIFTTLAGKGLQIAGATDKAYAGRAWDIWAAYNTTGQASVLTFGVKDVGRLSDEDNFNDGNYTGWNITAHTNISWTVTGSALRATVKSTGGYSYIYRNGLGIGVTNITLEYQTRFMNGAKHGGILYRGRVLYVNPQLCGWADGTPNYVTNGTGVTTGKWQHVVVNVRDGSPYMRSDLFVDGKPVFLDEPIESTSYTTNTVGFLSPYSPKNAYVEWDNVRIVDEQYVFATQSVNGVYLMTNGATVWAFVPDYDPNWWEHDGTLNGAQYQWYMYFRGDGVHSYQNVNVYFAPRLMVEATNFPTQLTRGQTVKVPVEWESLPSVPARLRISLQEAWSGIVYTTNTFTVTNLTGSGSYSVTIPSTAPSGAGYLWSAYLYKTNAADPWTERIGSDDTFRFRPDGIGFEPETTVTVVSVVNNTNTIYADTGLPSGASIYTWKGGTATFNGDYTGITPPEGTKCFMTTGSSWQGWGVFLAKSNMKTYSNGYLRFWARSSTQLKIDLEGPQNTKRTKYIASTTNKWKEFSLPISNFSGVVLTNMYGLFEATAESAGTFYIDNVRWTK